ncbi:MAG: hypothetical protein IT290_07215 [Deltaproteobacteria bacterium]|nr:hypothetical protein [Deltaproteobacteria bacterium]
MATSALIGTAVRTGLSVALPTIATAITGAGSGKSVSFEQNAKEMQAMQEKHLGDQMKMQMLMQEYTHKSNISKSLHEAAMAVLQNIRVR